MSSYLDYNTPGDRNRLSPFSVDVDGDLTIIDKLVASGTNDQLIEAIVGVSQGMRDVSSQGDMMGEDSAALMVMSCNELLAPDHVACLSDSIITTGDIICRQSCNCNTHTLQYCLQSWLLVASTHCSCLYNVSYYIYIYYYNSCRRLPAH